MARSVVNFTVYGERELKAALKEFDQSFRRTDLEGATRKAMRKATDAAGSFCKEGDRSREIVKRIGTRKKNKHDLSIKTDTVRRASHFIKFYRQGKPPVFVPITLNPYAEVSDRGISPEKGTAKYDQYDSERKRKQSSRGVPFLRYQERRRSTRDNSGRGGSGKFSSYDTASEIKKMRQIKRRGFAKQGWMWLGKTASKKSPKPYKKTVKASALKRWTKFKTSKTPFTFSQMAHNKLTYMKKAYGNFEPYIKARAAKFLRRETEDRLKRAAYKYQRKIRSELKAKGMM